MTNGIRIGTPAVTARGMQAAQMAEIAAFIDEALTSALSRSLEERRQALQERMHALCDAFPRYR